MRVAPLRIVKIAGYTGGRVFGMFDIRKQPSSLSRTSLTGASQLVWGDYNTWTYDEQLVWGDQLMHVGSYQLVWGDQVYNPAGQQLVWGDQVYSPERPATGMRRCRYDQRQPVGLGR